MAAASYLGGPVTGVSPPSSRRSPLRGVALLFLIIETQNDYVRFHGQSPRLLLTRV
jgi:hypothetical protein